ncbi:MAG: TRAP transporter small permease subunit [Pseudomonadota bacterium]|nr:TRAP transporter small permease subunit [Pseudomonadota bacterium]
MRLVGRALHGIATFCALLGALAIVLMMLQIVADVLLKNLISWPVPLTATLVTKWYMVAAAFLPLGLTEILDRHISVEVVYQQFPARMRRILGGLICVAACAVCICMVIPMWDEALKRFDKGTFILENGDRLIVWPGYFFLPLGFAVFAAVLAWRVTTLWGGVDSGMGEVRLDAVHDRAAEAAREGA